MRKKRLLLPALTVAAAGLLLISGVGSTRAALQYFSQDYLAHVEISDIGITLVENGSDISWRNYDYNNKDGNNWDKNTGELAANLVEVGQTEASDSIKLGVPYQEAITVRNSGHIDIYARVMLYCYWEDKNGNKINDADPSAICLHLNENSGWYLYDQTTERMTLYYTDVLSPDETAPYITDTLTIDGKIAQYVNTTTSTKVIDGETYTVYTDVFEYNDGRRFVIEADADAVQTHNAANASLSAWGVDITTIAK